MRPRFSVIIPTHARPQQLNTCLNGLRMQGYPRDEFEVIVVDDGGPKPLDAVVAPFEDVLTLRLIRQANRGPAAARNTGAQAARGEYLVFIDDDCLPLRDWLRELARVINEQPDCLIGGAIVNGLPDNPFSTATETITTAVYEYFNSHPSRGRVFNTANLAIPAASFHGLTGFCTALRWGEDHDFCYRWQDSGRPFRYAPAARVYHIHPLTFWSFSRQHFNYGRGLLRARLWVARRAGRLIRSEQPGFYLHLLTYPLHHWSGWRRWLYVGLIAFSQAATFAGACREICYSTEVQNPLPTPQKGKRNF
jgi:GT2 family glycosyltransferase